jgi:MGT family glycosyltransferase
MRPALDAIRGELALPLLERVSDVHDACALSLVATPREFEPAMPVPPNVRFIGPVLDAPPLLAGTEDVVCSADGRPLVLVSLSTSQQGQLGLLQRIVAALSELPVQAIVTTGPAIDPAVIEPRGGVRVARFAAHDRLLARAALMITHAGLGTVMTTLAQGVPILCMPLGRDQFFNAGRVEALGAGRALPADSPAGAIAATVRGLLGDTAVADGARRAAEAIAAYRNADAGVAALEALAGRSVAA